MEPVNKYLNHLNEDFSFVNKVFKANVIKNVVEKVKKSISGNRVKKDILDKALITIPVINHDKIVSFLDKYLANFKYNRNMAQQHFDKKHPEKKYNDTMATVAGMIASADDKKSVQDSIKITDRVYSRSGGSGGGAFVLLLIGLFASVGAFSLDQFELKHRAMAFALGALLIIASFRSMMD